jgi:hypothetical protein
MFTITMRPLAYNKNNHYLLLCFVFAFVLIVDTTKSSCCLAYMVGRIPQHTARLQQYCREKQQQQQQQHGTILTLAPRSDGAAEEDGDSVYTNNNNSLHRSIGTSTRRQMMASTCSLFLTTTTTTVFAVASPSHALVKGVAPPPPKSKTTAAGSADAGGTNRPKCTNVEECQALAEQREAELRAKEASGPPPMVTKGGVKYRDLSPTPGAQEDGNNGSPNAVVVIQDGDEVQLFFKVLKLGKRSYDGLSGEGTVVFSRGYGLEDDEDKPGVKTFTTVVGNQANIVALNEALIGMPLQGIRRFSIMPQKGWERAIAACDGGPGGSGAGGDVKTVSQCLFSFYAVSIHHLGTYNCEPFGGTPSFFVRAHLCSSFPQSTMKGLCSSPHGTTG